MKTDSSIDLNLRFLRLIKIQLIIVHKEVLLEVHAKKQKLLLQIEKAKVKVDKVPKASLGSKILTVKIHCNIQNQIPSFCENKWTLSKTNQFSKEIQTTDQRSMTTTHTTQWRRSMITFKI